MGCSRTKTIFAGFVLAVLAWTSLFLNGRDYGFYEDDYWAVVPYQNTTWAALTDQVRSAFLQWPQGRPLNHSVPMLFGFVGSLLGGVKGIYVLVFCVLLMNCWLVAALSKCSQSQIPSFLAGAAFIFYPADTTRLLIVHGAHLHLSLTYSLIGLLLLRSSRLPFKILAYAVSLLSLLSYETAYAIFAVGGIFYLLSFANGSRRWKTVLTHVLSCAIVLAIVVLIRVSFGEARFATAASNPVETLWRMASSLWIGPMTSLSSYWRAWEYGILHLESRAIWFTAVVLILLLTAIVVLFMTIARQEQRTRGSLPLWLVACGISIAIGSYGLTIINYPPNQIAGRLTSTHLAAGVGIALAVGGLLGTAESKLGPRALLAPAALIAFALAGTAPYFLKIQEDYAAAWSNQKQFWSGVLTALPDLRADDIVLISG
jgi:hypothetical protein